jgi:flagellar secretion chaperone FliS
MQRPKTKHQPDGLTMYGNASPFASRLHRPGNVYTRVGLETEVHDASPHRLIAMLFDGFFSALAQAEGALLAGHRDLKANALTRAVRILDEGLKAGLNLGEGGALAGQLHELYAYASLRLTQVNLHDDLAGLREVRQLIEPVREAWGQIAPAAEQPAAA